MLTETISSSFTGDHKGNKNLSSGQNSSAHNSMQLQPSSPKGRNRLDHTPAAGLELYAESSKQI